MWGPVSLNAKFNPIDALGVQILYKCRKNVPRLVECTRKPNDISFCKIQVRDFRKLVPDDKQKTYKNFIFNANCTGDSLKISKFFWL